MASKDVMLNATAKRDLKCPACSALIRKGERLLMYRERALSSHEACHAGRYPMRKRCAACAQKRVVQP